MCNIVIFRPVHCIKFNVIMNIFIRYSNLYALKSAMNSRNSVAIFAQHKKVCVALSEKQCCLCLLENVTLKLFSFFVIQTDLGLYSCSLTEGISSDCWNYL